MCSEGSEKAFDCVLRSNLWKVFQEYGGPLLSYSPCTTGAGAWLALLAVSWTFSQCVLDWLGCPLSLVMLMIFMDRFVLLLLAFFTELFYIENLLMAIYDTDVTLLWFCHFMAFGHSVKCFDWFLKFQLAGCGRRRTTNLLQLQVYLEHNFLAVHTQPSGRNSVWIKLGTPFIGMSCLKLC